MLTGMVSISRPRDPPVSTSQSAGITGVSHRARPQQLFLSTQIQIPFDKPNVQNKECMPSLMTYFVVMGKLKLYIFRVNSMMF